MNNYRFGSRSLAELEGVDEGLVAVCHRALELSRIDFGVYDGLRTPDEQRLLVQTGVSQTLNSKHLTGQAVDLVPFIGGRFRWEWKPIFEIAAAVRLAAVEQDIRIIWGGSWTELTNTTESPESMYLNYIRRKQAEGEKPFADGPHMQLI
jgi:peptidoglycan LD-endopeptidase CwlK